jgi:DNA-binding transcriptional MerR regulator
MAAPRKLFKVGEIMRHTKLSRQTVHNYTMLGLIKPAERTDSGHRLYGEEVFDRIKKIELLKLHHTLDEVRQMLLAEDEKKSEPIA